MNIEIKLHNYHIKLDNVVVEDYSADFNKLRKSFENNICLLYTSDAADE